MRDLLFITKALSDRNRLRALQALDRGELCLCQLIDLLELAPSTVSKHMTLLYEAGLVDRRKEGRWHFYRLATEQSEDASKALSWIIPSLARDPVVAADRQRLEEIRRKDLVELSTCYRA